MAGINKVILIGNLGKDPELKHTNGGTALCRMTVATTRSWTNRQTNERSEKTEWHQVLVWGKTAEHCSNYLSKGSKVYIEGRIEYSSYEDRNGVRRYNTDIVSETVQFLSVKNNGQQQSNSQQQSGSQQQGGFRRNQQQGQQPSSTEGLAGEPAPAEDDIPF